MRGLTKTMGECGEVCRQRLPLVGLLGRGTVLNRDIFRVEAFLEELPIVQWSSSRRSA